MRGETRVFDNIVDCTGRLHRIKLRIMGEWRQDDYDARHVCSQPVTLS